MNHEADSFQIDKALARASFNRAASSYDEVALLQTEVGQRMLERLELIKITPEWVIDVGAGTGKFTRDLAQRYRKSRIIALDFAFNMLSLARKRLTFKDRLLYHHAFLCGDAEKLPIADHVASMIFSNLALQWCTNLDVTFAEFRRVLTPGGLLMFSSFGPDTLKELRQSWKQVDKHVHVNAFMDMHDIGDALIRTGFSSPVMDVEYFTLTYPDVLKIMRDLKALGAHNVTQGRTRGLTGKSQFQQLVAAYEKLRNSAGLLPVTYEVVYGHAWMSEHSPQRTVGNAVQIPVSQIKRLK